MKGLIRAVPLYTFLRYCNSSGLRKKVLDCGAGGDCPPLSIFKENDYETYGIEISEHQIELAKEYCIQNNFNLNITKGDMRKITFENEAFSFVYSFNSIFHLTKKDIAITINEFKRVLIKDGLCFVNFLSINDEGYGCGEQIGNGEFFQDEGDEKVIHSYFYENEAEGYLNDFTILRKEYRNIDLYQNETKHVLSYIEFILKKN